MAKLMYFRRKHTAVYLSGEAGCPRQSLFTLVKMPGGDSSIPKYGEVL